ncbi:hypothetical protein FNV43_RR02072 [Rhamnella rubrinervis]|uniref:Uncharacterized protein n=1 Tax=Rhamnella rubrinervis TaxID=2594499 RepID=A0A8K0MTG1_9ROSA|nr:hypothetical protein FNV43_RR02072 [Rhamnella rubrinervis]
MQSLQDYPLKLSLPQHANSHVDPVHVNHVSVQFLLESISSWEVFDLFGRKLLNAQLLNKMKVTLSSANVVLNDIYSRWVAKVTCSAGADNTMRTVCAKGDTHGLSIRSMLQSSEECGH